MYLPTRQVGPDAVQGRVRLKNLLVLAEERLIGAGVRRPEATRLLEPARRLLDDESLWRHQGDGLALFIAPNVFHHYRLPRRFADLVVVRDRFSSFRSCPCSPATDVRGRLASETAPLVLAGVDAIRASYEGITVYPHVLEAGVHGSPDRMSAEQLHRLGWSHVEPGFTSERTKAVADFRRLDGTGLASARLTEVLAAADAGRVAVLLVREEPEAWEHRADLSPEPGGEEAPEPRPQDLLNDAAIHVVRGGGRVYVLVPKEMPDGVPAAALFRY